jgi:midasin (ATPase involved in ribosome maturation)
MNPGGDFGKRELSPALRNRFTEIWVPAISDESDVKTVVFGRIKANAKKEKRKTCVNCSPKQNGFAPLVASEVVDAMMQVLICFFFHLFV